MLDVAPIMLAESPLFTGVDSDLLVSIANAGRVRTIKGRFGRIETEEMAERLFFVISGEMRMTRMAPDGQECLMQRFGAGEFFCLAAVISAYSCKNQMVNAGTTKLMYWRHESFRKFADQSPRLYGNILGQMACQIEQEREMRALSHCCKAEVRVAAYLLHRIRQGHCMRKCNCVVDIKPISLTAQELGIARETLSRSLQRLVKREGIAYKGGIVEVTSVTCLEEVLEEAECSCCC